MTAYYNENDPFAAAWLRELIAEGLIVPGDVDTRSIIDVRPGDLAGYSQCHFFAGIGGWSYALRLAGWPDGRAVWTGSCPCQPFSAAGRKAGFSDPRHLWPVWFNIIAQCRPTVVFGEQSSQATDWLALVRSDLETVGYAVGAVPIEAASAGADQFRDRYWFVADTDVAVIRGEPSAGQLSRPQQDKRNSLSSVVDPARLGWGEGWTEAELRRRGMSASIASIGGCLVAECPDGKWRRIPPPGVRWLGNGLSGRVGALRGFGNAVDPRPTAQFIAAYLDVVGRR